MRRRDVVFAVLLATLVVLLGYVAELVEQAIESDPDPLLFADMIDDVAVAVVVGLVSYPVLRGHRRSQVREAEMATISAELRERREAEETAVERHAAIAARVREVVESRSLSIHLQPIFAADDTMGAPRGFEALARFADGRAPDAWFSEAGDVGLAVLLEMHAIHRALDLLPSLPPGAYLSVNASPETLVSDDLWVALRDREADRVVLELTEHLRIQDYDNLNRVLNRFRRLGVRIAVDDAGAGFSSLRHIIQIAPDLIKLDRDLIRNCDVDQVRRTLAQSLTSFARRIGATIVAEGVETPEELAALQSIEVSWIQGYLLGRPAPAAQVLAAQPAAP